MDRQSRAPPICTDVLSPAVNQLDTLHQPANKKDRQSVNQSSCLCMPIGSPRVAQSQSITQTCHWSCGRSIENTAHHQIAKGTQALHAHCQAWECWACASQAFHFMARSAHTRAGMESFQSTPGLTQLLDGKLAMYEALRNLFALRWQMSEILLGNQRRLDSGCAKFVAPIHSGGSRPGTQQSSPFFSTFFFAPA